MGRSIVIVEPEIPENTGFIARLCANFGYSLRLVKPEFNLSEARNTASGAQQKLRDARIFDSVQEAVRDLDFVVGTKPDRGVELETFTPRENTSIMLGRESNGLSNDELELCDAVVHIETGSYSSINLSHSASILMYSMTDREKPEGINKEQKTMISSECSEVMAKLLLRSNPSTEEFDGLMSEIMD
ncbi:MAG: RNA methyltransferase [Nanohaloarchaea archaeon]|nr:RNA methyltransferase [Candidatus Nanohaloarchaea archaeon]